MTEQINRIAEIWWNWMWPMFWQVSLLIGFVALIDFVIRKHLWPQVRYALWLLVLVKLVIPPSFALRTSVVSHVQPMIERSVRKPSVANEPTLYPATGEGMNPDEPLVARLPDAPEPVELAAGPEVVESPNRIDAGIGTAGTVRESLSWRAIGMLVWAATMLLLVLRLLLGHHALWHVHCAQKCSRALPPWLPKLAEDTARKLRLRRAPQVVLSSTVNCPAVLGVFRPILLLPEGTVEQVSRQQAQHILLHELAHIKRGDLPVHALCVLLQIFYWFNPLLVLVRRQLQHLRELCCDATVASILRDRTEDYYQTILQTVERLLEKPRWCGIGLLGLIEDPSRLRVRLAWLRKKPSRYPGLRRATASALVVTMLTFILPMAKAEKSVEGNTVLTGEADEKTTKSLHEAVSDGDIEQVRLHLSRDTDIESKDRNGRTALHIAAIKGYAEIARLLISKGADINAKDTWNSHPLYLAAWCGHKDVAEVLIAKGAIV
jgi:beta-lactamase regulating signal transducer with metallopeptidase domain